MPINIPTSLTWLRIILIPVFVGVYYLPETWLAPATLASFVLLFGCFLECKRQ